MSERTRQIEQVAVLSVIALLVIGSIMMVLPFARAILWALVFAVTIWPFFIRIEKALGGRASLAALVPTLVLALIFFLPMIFVTSKLISQMPIAFDYVREILEKGLGPPPSWLSGLPLIGKKLEGSWRDIGRDAPTLIEAARPYIRTLLDSIMSAGAGMGRLILTMLLSLILFFFFLKEGHSIKAGLERMAVRLGGEKGLHLLRVAGSTMRSVVYGILGAAILQGVMAIFGLWISGVPNPIFLGLVAGFFALIPIGLIQVVLLPAAGWLIYQGQTGWGIFLFLWSFPVIGNVDSVIRPMLISRGANVPFLVVLLGVLGGLATGGIVGLFVGATLLSVFYTMLKEWVEVPDEDSSGAHQSKPQS